MADFFDSILGRNVTPSYGPSANSSWNLLRGVFTQKDDPSKSVVFFTETSEGEARNARSAVDQISDSGGRRLAIYEYPYQDGQKVKDLGRRGETHNFNIVFHGDNYQARFQQFLKIVNTPSAGTMSHPTISPIRGTITVRFRDYEIMHRSDQWNAVTIRATFVDDDTDALDQAEPALSINSALKASVQDVVDAQITISSLITAVGVALSIPSQALSSLQARLLAVVNLKAQLLGQLASTFNLKSAFTKLLGDAAALAGGLFSITGGTSASGSSAIAVGSTLPPAFQVGFDPVTQAVVDSNVASYTSSNQISPQQAVFQANQVRASITAAINEINDVMGNAGSDIVLQYRSLAISVQQAVESALAAQQASTKLYTLPYTMSLRAVAFENGLDPDRGNDIEALNPYLPSVNLVPKGSVLSVPVA